MADLSLGLSLHYVCGHNSLEILSNQELKFDGGNLSQNLPSWQTSSVTN